MKDGRTNSPGSAAPRPTPREAAIAGILGLSPDADAGELLGVDASNTDEAEVVDALNQRLANVNAHRYGGTPLGDEARLALHAAAAQLLGTRRRSSEFDAPADGSSDLPARWSRPRALPPAHMALQQDAVMALGAHGGWNATTMRHLTMLAHARGLTGDDLAVALTRLARQSGPPAPAQDDALPGEETSADPGRFAPQDHGVRSSGGDLALLGAMAVAVVLTLMAAAAVLIAIPVMRSGSLTAQQASDQAAGQASAEESQAVSDPQPSDEPPTVATAQSASEERAAGEAPATRIDTIVTDLRLANDRRRKGERGAQAAFERAVLILADNWHRVRPDQRQAALGLVIDHLYLVRENAEATRRVAGFLTGKLAQDGQEPSISARIWQVGAVVRLSKEQNLPTAAADRLRAYLLGDAPLEARAAGDFASGVAVALQAELRTLVDADDFETDLTAWDAWLANAAGLAVSDPALAQRLMIAGLEAVLLLGPEPTSERVFQIVRRFVVALQWRPGDESRARLLAWFQDPAVSVADLHAVTNVLATASGAPGVDPTMVLPVLADEAQRSRVRDRLAASWGVRSTIAQGEVANRWLSEARRHLEQDIPNDQAAQASDAAVSARLVAAASLLLQGQASESDAQIMQLRSGLEPGQQRREPGTRSIYMASHSDPSPWALRYLEQRRPELQVDLLDELLRNGPTHAVEAELVAEAFLRGSTLGVRERASQILTGHASKPVVIAAALETLPLPGADVRRRQMVEMITGVKLPAGEQWELVARRSLVERLLELLAAQGDLAQIDHAAEALAEAYARSLAKPAEGSLEDDTPPELAAELLWDRARQRAERLVPPAVWPWTPGEVDRRLAGRTRLAQGRVQWFAAYQSALAEIELYNTAAERPSLAVRLGDELAAMQEARRDARGVLQQVAIVERARLQAWMHRLSEATAGGPQ